MSSARCTSKERDAESGLDFFNARYMSSAQGRFTSPDAAGPDLTNPQTLNKYRYALNNPLRYIDPNGLYEWDVHRNLTYSLALAAGIDDSIAGRISAADQGVDDNPATSPMHIVGGTDARANWHFTTPERRSILWNGFARGHSPEALGVFLHAQQDSYSHEGFGPALGQTATWRVWDMSGPDYTYKDPAKADLMAADTLTQLLVAGQALGAYRPLDTKVVGAYVQRFNRATTGKDKIKILNELNGVARENIRRQMDSGNGRGGPAAEDAQRQCSLGNQAACNF